jgi:Flp pilus assembly protein TadD
MAARVLVLAAAVLLGGFAAIALHDEHACHTAGVELFRAVAHGDVTAGVADDYVGACRGARGLATAADSLAAAGSVTQAVRLADAAIRREPRSYEGWAALSAALRRRGLDAAADRALREARRLNPRLGRPPG